MGQKILLPNRKVNKVRSVLGKSHFSGQLLHLDNDCKCSLGFSDSYKNDHSRKTHLHFFACGVGEQWGKAGQGKSASALTKLQVLTQAQIVGKETIYMFCICTSVLNSTT